MDTEETGLVFNKLLSTLSVLKSLLLRIIDQGVEVRPDFSRMLGAQHFRLKNKHRDVTRKCMSS